MGTLSYGFLSYLCGDNKICEGIEFVTWGPEGNTEIFNLGTYTVLFAAITVHWNQITT